MDVAELSFRVNTRELDNANRSLRDLREAGDRLERTNGRVDQSIQGVNRGFGNTSGILTAVGSAVAALGIVELGKNMLMTARDFEAGMNNIEEKTNATAAQMEVLREAALQMGQSTAFSATEAADAMGELAAMGVETNSIVGILPDVLNLASAAQVDLARSAQITTETLGQFGLGIEESTRVVDLLAAVGDSSSITLEQLASSMVKAGPAASSFGVGMEETAAALAVMAQGGVKAEIAGTALAGMFRRLMVPVGDGSKAMTEAGLAAADFVRVTADGREEFIGVAAAIDLLNNAGVSSTQMMRILGAEAGVNLVGLVGAGGDAVRDMSESFGEASTAAEQAQTQMKGLPGAILLAKSAFEGLSLAITDLGITDLADKSLRALADTLNDVSRNVESFGGDIKKTVAAISIEWAAFKANLNFSNEAPWVALRTITTALGDMGTALRPVLPYLGELVVGMGLVGTALVAAKVSVAAFGLALGAATAPITLTIAGIAALGVAAKALYDNWDGVKAWWASSWDSMQKDVDGFLNWWKATSFDEKVVEIDTTLLDAARDTADAFFDWWDRSELKEHAPEIVLDAMEAARDLSTEFFDWWESRDFDSKVLEIEAMAVEFAQGLAEDFFNWWNDEDISERELEVDTTLMEDAEELVGQFFDLWNDSELKEFAPEIVVDAIEEAEKYITGFFDWWNDNPLDQIVADITFEAITTAWEYIDRFVEWWDGLVSSIKSIDLEIEMPDFSGVQEGFGKLVDWFKDIGADVSAGLAQGIERANEHEAAGKEMAETTIAAVKEGFEIQSPSRAMMRLAEDVVEGFAIGIQNGYGFIADSANSMTEAFMESVSTIREGITQQMLYMKGGAELVQLYVNMKEGMTNEEARVALALDKGRQALENYNRGIDLGIRAIDDLKDSQKVFNAELEGGPVAARAMELSLRDMNEEYARNVAETEAALAAQIAFRDGLQNAIAGASNFKDAFREIGNFAKDWLQEQIAYFAANEITAVLGVDGSGIAGQMSGILQGVVKSVSGVIGDIGSAVTGGFSSIAGSVSGVVGNMGGFVSNAFTSMFGTAQNSATQAGLASTQSALAVQRLTGETAAMGSGLMAAIAPMGAVAAGAVLLSQVFGGDDGRNNLRDVMIRVVDGIVEVRQRMGDEGGQLVTQIQQVFDGLVTGVRTQAELLGVEGADAIMEGYSNATGRLSIDDIAADSEAWLGRLGRVAYQQLYDTLGPELQAAIDASVDLANSSIDDIEAAFGRLTFIATDIVPLFDAAGIQISNSTQQTIAGVEGIVAALESMGIPINESIGLIQQLIPGFDAATFAMQQNELAISDWNESIGQISTSATTTADDMRLLWGALDQAGMSSGIAADMIQQFVTEANGVATLDVVALQNYIASLDQTTVAGQAASEAAGVLANAFGVDLSQSMITSMAGLTQYIASLDATSEGYDQAVASAIALIPAIQAVEAAEAARIETMNGVAESFRGIGVVFDTMIPSALGASEALITAAGGMDQFTSDMSFYLNNFYSEAERAEIVLANAAGEVSAFNDMLGLTGAEAIDTREELRAYLDELVASGAIYTETGAEAYAAGLAVAEAIDAMTNSGLSLEEAIQSLPPELQAVAQGMGLVGDESAGVGDQMSQAAQMFYDAAQLIAIAAGVSKTELGGLETALANMGGAVGTAVTDVLAHVTLFGTKFPDINRTLDDVAARTKVAQEAMAASTRTLDSDTAASAAKVLQSVAAMTQALDQVAAAMVTSAGAVDGAAAQVTQSFMALAQDIQAATALVVAATNTAGMSMAEMARSMTASAGQVTQAGFTGSTAITSLAQIISASASSVKGSSLSLTGSMQAMSGSLITAAGQVNSASATAGGAMNTLAGIFASGAKGISSASAVAGNAMRTLASNVQSGAGSINSAAGSVGGGLNSVSSKIRGFLSSISSAAGSAAKSAQAAQNAAKNASSGGLGGIAGSFATGLDYVPRDGFVAELHKGEMVVPADIAEGLRAAGVYAQQPSANAPSVALSRPNNTSEGTVVVLRAIEKKLDDILKQDQESSNRSASILGNIAGTNSRQVQGIETVRRELDQQSKKLALR